MGWTGPYPTLSRKRPTADLVSRKVLTPLLGQICLVVLAQLVVFEIVQKQTWYVLYPAYYARNFILIIIQVSATPARPGEEQYRELTEHGALPILVLPIHIPQHCDECWAPIPAINDFER